MGLADVVKGCKDKASALRAFARRHELELADVAFMGDDVNDLPAMEIAGLSASPANAQPAVLARAAFVSQRSGGDGAVRELVDAILTARASIRPLMSA
jgi:YrbI family 3-deoxy-D-manno-octulosonate 8-phosphate phosphatase